jgi:mannose-6-phosphate isomerase-like protein (cupin superfamily)
MTARPAPPRQVPPQAFTVSHLSESHFDSGLRSYASYRDLGFAKATQGLAVAHVIRFKPPCTDEVRVWHTHDVEFQMVYVLKGWITTEMEGHAPVKMLTGSSWMQPPKMRHRVVDYSDDCEVLEVVLPADFDTDMAVGAPAKS